MNYKNERFDKAEVKRQRKASKRQRDMKRTMAGMNYSDENKLNIPKFKSPWHPNHMLACNDSWADYVYVLHADRRFRRSECERQNALSRRDLRCEKG